jgi:hypothetical protein
MKTKQQIIGLLMGFCAWMFALPCFAQATFQVNRVKVVMTGEPHLVLNGFDFDNQGSIQGAFNLKFMGRRALQFNSLEPVELANLRIATSVDFNDDATVKDSIYLSNGHLNLNNSNIHYSTYNRARLVGESKFSQVRSEGNGHLSGIYRFGGGFVFKPGDLGLYSVPESPGIQVEVLRGHTPMINQWMTGINRWYRIALPDDLNGDLPAISLRINYEDYELNNIPEGQLYVWALDIRANRWRRYIPTNRDLEANVISVRDIPLPAYITMGPPADIVQGDLVMATPQALKPTASLSVYPNPTPDLLNIQIQTEKADEMAIVECLDLNGRMVFSESMVLQAGENRLEKSLAGLSNGVYLIRVAGIPESSIRVLKQ